MKAKEMREQTVDELQVKEREFYDQLIQVAFSGSNSSTGKAGKDPEGPARSGSNKNR